MDAKKQVPLASFVDLLLDAVCVVDAEGRFVSVSAGCEHVFGYTPEELIGKAMIDMVVPEDRARTLEAAREIMSGQPKLNFENRYIRKDGEVVHILWSARWSEADQLRVAVARDITERKRAESMQAALYAISEAAHGADDLLSLFRQMHRIIGGLLPATNFSMALYDRKTGQLDFPYHTDEYAEPSVSRHPAVQQLYAEVMRAGQPMLLGQASLIQRPEVLSVFGEANLSCWLGVPLKSQNGAIGVLALRSYKGGTDYTEKDKELLQFISTQVATAIERKQLHERLQYMSQYDELTGLPNRGLLFDRMEMALARARRESRCLAVLYLDLDNFKQVNDSLGHAAGDLLLQEVASRLKRCVRDPDTVARLGGDEFVVLLENIQQPEHISILAKKIRDAISQPVKIADRLLNVLPSIGIACYPEHGDGVRQLLGHADAAMYAEKHQGNNRTQTSDH